MTAAAGQVAWHTERIVCPECGHVTEARVEHTWPWYSYVHTCECGYVILEAEWELAPSVQGRPTMAGVTGEDTK
jgi:acetone carboxylase gamma subunit